MNEPETETETERDHLKRELGRTKRKWPTTLGGKSAMPNAKHTAHTLIKLAALLPASTPITLLTNANPRVSNGETQFETR